MTRSPIKAPAPMPKVGDQAQDRANDLLHRKLTELCDMSRDGGTGGRYLGRQILTKTGEYRPAIGTTRAIVVMIGGGGGGGGAQAGVSAGAGAGGTSGVLMKLSVGDGKRRITGGPFVCGAAGIAGTNVPTAGTSGGESILTIDGQTYKCPGGQGGPGRTGTTLSDAVIPPTPIIPSVDRRPMPIFSFGLGIFGYNDAAGMAWVAGSGGTTELGAGGNAVNGTVDGNPGQGYGSGGSGGASQFGGTTGGAGAPGVLIVDEYGGD